MRESHLMEKQRRLERMPEGKKYCRGEQIMDATEFELRKRIEILEEKLNQLQNHLHIMFLHDDFVNTIQLIDLNDDTD